MKTAPAERPDERRDAVLRRMLGSVPAPRVSEGVVAKNDESELRDRPNPKGSGGGYGGTRTRILPITIRVLCDLGRLGNSPSVYPVQLRTPKGRVIESLVEETFGAKARRVRASCGIPGFARQREPGDLMSG